MRVKRKRVDVNLEELDRVLDHAREAPLSERSAARSGGDAAITTLYGEDQRRASAHRSAGEAEQRKAQRPRA
jgi:hypothetical protein